MNTTILWLLLFSTKTATAASVITGGSPPSSGGTDPITFILNIYDFSLAIGGLLAFGMIVLGGFQYITAAGNSSRQSAGKTRILNALIGLLLLVGAYVLLNTLNPNITHNLVFPTI